MDENRNLPVPAIDIIPTDKPTPAAHCATLTEVFPAIGAHIGYRLSAGTTVTVPDTWGLSEQDAARLTKRGTTRPSR